MNSFLPVNKQDMEQRGWEQADFVYLLADAYVDHPSFGAAIISRVLESHGFKVAIIAQPDWKDPDSITVCGKPRLAFLISGGNMDPMVNHYTVAKKRRSSDAYSPGGRMGLRPDHASVVYSNLVRRVYGDIPIVIGGIEASLRRLAHYDYWSDSLKRSLLLDAQADLISFGMGERSVVEIAEALDAGLPIDQITYVDGTVYKTKDPSAVFDGVMLPSFDSMRQDRREYARSFALQYKNSDPVTGKRLIEPYGEHEFVVANPPARPLDRSELDRVYGLPYCRSWHPCYDKAGGVPALAEVKFSLTSCRGCFGSCSFCALAFHQGRVVQSRSQESLLAEAKGFLSEPDFKGYIHDVGGPTANFRGPACARQAEKGACPDRQCLFPAPCPNMQADHSEYMQLLRRLRELPGVKKVFVRSGVRFDYLLADRNHRAVLKELCRHHISGRLKAAPEHVSERVLRLMGKPENRVYQRFLAEYVKVNAELKRDQYVEPYLMSSHPGSTLAEAVELAEYLRDSHGRPEQVQDFYPTPSTVSTCMYYTGLDPRTMEPVAVARSPHEKAMQRALVQYREPGNYALVKEALLKAGRADLISFGKNCLIPPRPLKEAPAKAGTEKDKSRGKNLSGKKAPGKSSGHGKAAAKPAGKSKTGKAHGRGPAKKRDR
ncbi:MAG: YgiQ family radical SAM protein [Firmicutes bacterium]|nr:YgiQ family radical SAM protein [Bacillota bacterium]